MVRILFHPDQFLRNSFLGFQAGCAALHATKCRSERRYIQNDHDESEKIHSHCHANPDVHCTNANQPNLPCLAVPDKKWVCDFQETNKYSCNWKYVIPSNEYLGINDVEWWADESAPHTRAIPPAATKAFG
jgi:hypothetical protein